MVLKLYSAARSTCGQRVAMVLNEKGVPFELNVIDLTKGEHKAPEFVEKQPFGQVPYLDDDGFIIYESRAIAKYIEAKYPGKGTKLAPAADDLKALGLFEQAYSVEISNFNPHVSGAVFEKLFKPMMGGTTDEAAFAAHVDKLDKSLQVYDKILSKQKYVAGDELTMVDLSHIPYGALLEHVGDKSMFKYPNVERWWKEITARPSWTAVAQQITSTAA